MKLPGMLIENTRIEFEPKTNTATISGCSKQSIFSLSVLIKAFGWKVKHEAEARHNHNKPRKLAGNSRKHKRRKA